MVKSIQKSFIEAQDKIKYHWVPGHCNIPGNEAADREAKKAACADNFPQEHTTELQEVKKLINSKAKEAWEKKWRQVRGEVHLGRVYPSIHTVNQLKHSSRKNEVLFTQLRLGNCKLNKALYQIKKLTLQCAITVLRKNLQNTS